MDDYPQREMHQEWDRVFQRAAPGILHCTASILGIQNERLIQVASGVLVRIGTRSFVFTAAHCLDLLKVHHIPLGLNPVSGGPSLLLLDQKMTASPLPEGVDPKDKNARLADDYDIGVIELNDSFVATMPSYYRFLSLSEIHPTFRPASGCYLLCGYPYSLSDTNLEQRTVLCNPELYLTSLAEEPMHKNGIQVQLQYRKHFTRGGDGMRIPAPEPEALSGCGVWRLSDMRPSAAWTPDEAKLVAIQHTHHGDIVRATPVIFILQSLYRRNLDLRALMDLHFGTTTKDW